MDNITTICRTCGQSELNESSIRDAIYDLIPDRMQTAKDLDVVINGYLSQLQSATDKCNRVINEYCQKQRDIEIDITGKRILLKESQDHAQSLTKRILRFEKREKAYLKYIKDLELGILNHLAEC